MIAAGLSNVSKYYGATRVLEAITWDVQERDRVGLVGPNGAGKSTLLRVIAGLEPVEEGEVHRKRGLTFAYLPQEPEFESGLTVLDEVLASDSRIERLEGELRRLEARMGERAVYEDGERLAAVMEQHARALEAHERAGGLNYRGRAESVLRSLGLTEAELALHTDALSGGQKKLVGLARALVQQPDVLLLDEPDNHLDLDGKVMLERLIVDYPGAVVIVSHDRHMLDLVADSIAELESPGLHPGRPQLAVFAGNYSEYAHSKRQLLLKQHKDHRLQEREVQRLEASIRRLISFSSGGQNEKLVRRAKSMQKRLDKMERIERPILEPRRMNLRLESERGSKKVLDITDLHKGFDGEPLLEGLELLIWAGERVGLVGPNGAGKSVLFRIIRGEETANGGAVKLGPSVTAAYYAQEHETLDQTRTPVEEVRLLATMSETEAHSFLGSFLFDYQKARRAVASLSGGEKSRLQMAKLMLTRGNLLLLDEPTNNLDIPSCEALEEALADYEGTVLVISHDRYFLDRVVGRVVELESGRLSDYAGNYADYREAKAAAAV